MVNELKIKPIRVITEKQLSYLEKSAILEGITVVRDVIKDISGQKMPIKYFGACDNTDMRFVYEIGKKYSSKSSQVNPNVMIDYLTSFSNIDSSYLVCITKNDMSIGENINNMISKIINYGTNNHGNYDHGTNDQFICGVASERGPAIISTYRPINWMENKELNRRNVGKIIELITMHEIGHMFGLPNKNRKSIKKQHCADKNCIMTYKGFTISNNWIEKKYDKFHKAPFCSECLLDLEDRLNQ